MRGGGVWGEGGVGVWGKGLCFWGMREHSKYSYDILFVIQKSISMFYGIASEMIISCPGGIRCSSPPSILPTMSGLYSLSCEDKREIFLYRSWDNLASLLIVSISVASVISEKGC
uniref:ORF113 n=1 Tax=Malaco herpesvirus 1 TaxID=3031797 RepID=A0AA48P963_9VIRU|nr:TPA_asm: ORF113 [Malaco herpesvirus 1]